MSKKDALKVAAQFGALMCSNPDDHVLDVVAESLPTTDELRKTSLQVVVRKAAEEILLRDNLPEFWEQKSKDLANLAIFSLLIHVRSNVEKSAQNGEREFWITLSVLPDAEDKRFLDALEKFTQRTQFHADFADLSWVLSSSDGKELSEHGMKAVEYLKRVYSVEVTPGTVPTALTDIYQDSEFVRLRIWW